MFSIMGMIWRDGELQIFSGGERIIRYIIFGLVWHSRSGGYRNRIRTYEGSKNQKKRTERNKEKKA